MKKISVQKNKNELKFGRRLTQHTAILTLTIIGFASQGLLSATEAAVLVTNPSDHLNNINTLGRSMHEEVGNIDLGTFNNLQDQHTFTFDTPSYTGTNPTDDSFVLTSGVSGVDKTLNMSFVGGFRLILAASGGFLSSGDQSLTVGAGVSTSTFTFDTAVQAFGFTANSLGGAGLTVNLYSDSGGSSLIDSFFLAVNTATDHSFFGYESASQNILRIDLVGTVSTDQHAIDDISFSNNLIATAAPEPSSLALLAGGLIMLTASRRKFKATRIS